MDTSADPRPLVFVTVGTDHHRFDRLMDWVERWLGTVDPAEVRCVVQHGYSRPVAGAECVRLLAHPDLLGHLGQAAVVLAQGGPGSIMDARGCGVLPIVVPRVRRLREVVDDHQVAFTRRLAAEGLVVSVETEAGMVAALTRALANPSAFRVTSDTGEVEKTARQVDQLVAAAVAGPRTLSRVLPRIGQLLRSRSADPAGSLDPGAD